MWNPCLLLLSSFFLGLEHQGSSRVIHLQPGVLFAFKDSSHLIYLNFTLFCSQSSLRGNVVETGKGYRGLPSHLVHWCWHTPWQLRNCVLKSKKNWNLLKSLSFVFSSDGSCHHRLLPLWRSPAPWFHWTLGSFWKKFPSELSDCYLGKLSTIWRMSSILGNSSQNLKFSFLLLEEQRCL